LIILNWRSDVLESGLRSSDGLAFVYTEDNRIIGFVCAHDLGFRGYLSEIVVAQTLQHRGIGKSLLNAVEKELTKRGCEILAADV
jgi:ribosomal protein S18 acetylase RimI-like enzyme